MEIFHAEICGIILERVKVILWFTKDYKKLKNTIKFSPLSSMYQQVTKTPPLFNLSSNTPLSSSRKHVALRIGFDVLGFELCDTGYT
jgi:hypothetical protein